MIVGTVTLPACGWRKRAVFCFELTTPKLLTKLGGFARVHELTDLTSNRTFAGKIIPRSRLTTSDQRKKLYREIEIHEPLAHKHVVRFQHFFKDEHNVYIVLEYCPRKSLVHVLKNRKVLTEPEVRYFLAQLVDGVKYIHSQGVMHRDLKLGNMFLSDQMHVKIGDFGLAAKAYLHLNNHDGSKKITVCGTPNYIAPEVLNMKGHGFEADVWAIGCIMYAMLAGCPPFETSSLSDTYHRITNNIYTIPEGVSEPAQKLIQWLLRPRPQDRPTLEQILTHEFFTSGYYPRQLSPTCCYSAPRFYSKSPDRESDATNKLTAMVANINIDPPPQRTKTPRSPAGSPLHKPQPASSLGKSSFPQAFRQRIHSVLCPDTAGLKKGKMGTTMLLHRTLARAVEEISDVASEVNPPPVNGLCVPFVTKWIDYSNKYGFGFQLSDHSVGVLFNDTTRISYSANRQRVEYHDINGKVSVFTPASIPPTLEDRFYVLKYFANYMEENLNEGGDLEMQQEAMRRKQCIPTMKRWVRTNQAIVMQLSCSTLQVNFLSDHTKMVVNCERPSEPLLMYINEERKGMTYSLNELARVGCSPAIRSRIQYALNTLQDLIKIQQQQQV
ncbi:serine/threonine-protein kinase PLK2-like [Varroa jacobsoni]|uniref:serine/threonine-protein kinase PLK2-like n=1 Tax=Varroa jacobsoni TaxID=62625 RepID=UPI000BF362D2|nr:serine/threonine-protein kinase PLK2-like [Varroa jacobsoni]